MKMTMLSIIVALSWSVNVFAQDAVLIPVEGELTIFKQDSVIVVSSYGRPFGGFYTQNGLVMAFEEFPLFLGSGGPSSTRNLPAIKDLQVYPNPVAETAILERESDSEEYHIRILDTQGVSLQTAEWKSGQSKLELSLNDRPPGIYILSVMDEKMTKATHFKIIKH